jgi:hypothetical protein
MKMPFRSFRERTRHRNAAAHRPHQPGTCPRHALQKAAPVNAVIVKILQLLIDKVLLLVSHFSSVDGKFSVDNWRDLFLFPRLDFF